MTAIRSLPGMLFDQAGRRGGAIAMRHKALGIWHRVTWSEYAESVRKVAASLVAFWCGEFANSLVMAKMKVLTRGRHHARHEAEYGREGGLVPPVGSGRQPDREHAHRREQGAELGDGGAVALSGPTDSR